MMQMELFYLGVKYSGVIDDYYFLGTQEGIYLPDFNLYQGLNSHNTIADKSIEGLVEMQRIVDKNNGVGR